jgi:hypothetical protein
VWSSSDQQRLELRLVTVLLRQPAQSVMRSGIEAPPGGAVPCTAPACVRHRASLPSSPLRLVSAPGHSELVADSFSPGLSPPTRIFLLDLSSVCATHMPLNRHKFAVCLSLQPRDPVPCSTMATLPSSSLMSEGDRRWG